MNRVPLTIFLLLPALPVLAADDESGETVVITYREQITNFWGGREVKLHLVVAAQEALAGELNWSLHAAGRTLISRTSQIRIAAGGKTEVEVRCTLPPVNDAVIYPIELRAWAGMWGPEPAAELRERFYLFGNNPFAERKDWLKSLKIQLFDPENKTAEAFEKLEIPFERITNLATIEDIPEGVLIIGEDVEWEDYGELGPVFLAAAARGVNVLCLSGAKAEFPLPTSKQGEPTTAKQLSFRQTDVLRDLDKRLSMHWTGEHAVVSQSLTLVAENDQVLARAVAPDLGWPWMEVRFPQQAGRPRALVWCGLGLIRSWEESPTPRYVLLNWLEKTGQQEDRERASSDNSR
jgi:hypothetical protein